MLIIVQGSVCTEKHIVWRGYSLTHWVTVEMLKKKGIAVHPTLQLTYKQSIHMFRLVNEKMRRHMFEIFCIQRNMVEKVWTMICYRQGHSRLIIWQFRTVHFLVNILFSGKNLCLVPLCLIIGACVNLGQRTGVTDEQHLPPLASVSSSPGVSFAGTQCGGGG